MIVTFLGTATSQGVPMIACSCKVCKSTSSKDKRLRSSILIRYNDCTIVVDTGPDFRYQMLRAQVQTLDAILFTHEHKDHVAGLDDVRAFNHFQQQAMDIFADARTQQQLKQEFSYVFQNQQYPGIPKIALHTVSKDQVFEVAGHPIIPIEVLHYKLPVLGFRFGDFTYITDANSIEDSEKEKIFGSKILVLNALRKEEHISHFSLEQAVALAKELQIPQVYFTHMSHQMGLHEEVNLGLPSGMELAYDGLTINV